MAQRDPRRAEPPPTETGPVPIAYVRAEARYFGLPPHVLVLALGALGVGAAIGLLAGGRLVLGLVLLALGLLAGALFLEQARRRRASTVEVALADGVDRVRDLSGFAAASMRTLSRAGLDVARLRLEARRLSRERGRLQHELGGAVYRGDEAAREALLARMRELDARLATCVERSQGVVGAAREHVASERLAVERTEIRRPG